jgi:hypothetical protein
MVASQSCHRLWFEGMLVDRRDCPNLSTRKFMLLKRPIAIRAEQEWNCAHGFDHIVDTRCVVTAQPLQTAHLRGCASSLVAKIVLIKSGRKEVRKRLPINSFTSPENKRPKQ